MKPARSRPAFIAAASVAGMTIATLVAILVLSSETRAQDGTTVASHDGHGVHDVSRHMVGDGVSAPGPADATDYLLDLPAAKPYKPGRVREFTLIAEESTVEIADGVEYPAWVYREPGKDATVPGPLLRVTEGDLVRITLRNDSTQPHSIHTHGIHPAEQDGVLEVVPPGEEFTYEFTAGPSGVQPYHCHAMPLKKHIERGLYGTIIIDPKEPPAPADREMAMVMNGFDTNFDGENEVYTVNGKAFIYAKYPIQVKRGENVRIYLANMTEHDPLNSFHLHGNFFDYRPVGFDNPKTYTDVITQIQGDRGIIDMQFPETGKYMFHAHQTEFAELGWMGFFEVTE